MPTPDNRSACKLSPDHDLTKQQEILIQEILRFCTDNASRKRKVLVLQGAAGTGKSIVLNTAFARLRALSNQNSPDISDHRNSILLVNHPEMIKLYRRISEGIAFLRKCDYERPTTFINKARKTGQNTDIVFIDEAHLLLSRRDAYNHFRQDNHLEEILKISRIVVMVFDPTQVLKLKSFWNEKTLHDILGDRDVLFCHLTQQFRMHANEDVEQWIKAFSRQELLPLPAHQEFDFRIFDDAQNMYEAICQHEQETGLSRILATYDYPYVLNGQDHFITEGRFHLRWDRSMPEARLPWAERPDTINEVGSVYTIQGFDLNYAGIILGPSIDYDASSGRITADPSLYEDQMAFNGKNDIDPQGKIQTSIMMNAINVLMTRPMKGLYLYASSPKLRQQLMTLNDQRGVSDKNSLKKNK